MTGYPVVVRSVAAIVPLLAACHAGMPASGAAAPSHGRIWGSLPLSIVGTVVGAVAGVVVIGSSLGCTDEGAGCTHGPDNGEYIAGGLVSGLGAAAGAYLGGLRHDSRGRFWLDLVTAMVPASIVAIASGASNSEDACGNVCLIPFFASPVAATAVDYHWRVSR